MALTGFADQSPLICPAPLARCAADVGSALETVAPGCFTELDAAALLGERAAIAGLTRNGAIAPGGACRLFAARDGVIAINIPRPEDWELVPAWLETERIIDWEALGEAVATHDIGELIARARLLGLAVASEEAPRHCGWFSLREVTRKTPPLHPPLVIDLSSLWAGPLAGQLLRQAGARVIKVESWARPDGARQGPPAFFDLLNAGKESVALDFARDKSRLQALLARADIVIEASRPRALRQLGVYAEDFVKARPGLVWVSITGYGRGGPEADWVAFGDDAGVAAGLSHIMRESYGRSVFCGDAIADPLAGLHAALAGLAAFRTGQGGLYSIALRDVVAHCALFDPPKEGWAARARAWSGVTAAPPRARAVSARAASLGTDTTRILREFSC
jgi:hypothetical protein